MLYDTNHTRLVGVIIKFGLIKFCLSEKKISAFPGFIIFIRIEERYVCAIKRK